MQIHCHGLLPHGQLFRTAADHRRRGVYLRAPQMSDYGEWATLREASRAFLTPWEPTWPADDLSRARVPPPAAALCRGPALRPVLCVLPVPQERPRAGRRADARQCPPRRRAGRQPRLLDRRAVRAARADDRGGAGAGAVRVRLAAAAPARGRLHSVQRGLDPAAGKGRLRARGLCAANISASTGCGRTTCCSRALRAIDRALLTAPWGRQGRAAITKPECL